MALTVLCCSLRLAVADRPVDDTLPAWMQSALQQATKFAATRAEQGMPQETPPVIAAFDVSPNASGQLATFQPYGPTQTVTNAFFADLGTNGRTCMTCHQPQNGWTISPQDVEARFRASDGKDPLFRPIDGATCPTDDVSTPAAMKRAYTLLRTKGLIRVALSLPAEPQFTIRVIDDPYGCNTNPATGLQDAKNGTKTGTVSVYRRPLPSTNLGFLSALMWDGRETSLTTQALHATQIHAQASTDPTPTQTAQIVSFELGLYTAQFMDEAAGSLAAEGAAGGPVALSQQPFFVGINDPLGQNPTGKPFDPEVFTLYTAWERLPGQGKQQEREAVARGARLFNTRPIAITGVAGLNDMPDRSLIMGTCTTCHDTPNVGNHSVRLPLNIGISDVSDAKHPPPDLPLFELQCPGAPPVQTTDPGRALITGQCADIGKFKGPILRGLAARPPYFHNGSAATLEEVVAFYNDRFQLNLTHQEQADLAAFLRAL
jgi:cytochrome c peroxidase